MKVQMNKKNKVGINCIFAFFVIKEAMFCAFHSKSFLYKINPLIKKNKGIRKRINNELKLKKLPPPNEKSLPNE